MNKELLSTLLSTWEIPQDARTLDRFSEYCALLQEQGDSFNLIADTDENIILHRHFLDSLAPMKAGMKESASAIDVGTGAGFPGVPLKIAMPALRLTLMDSLGKRTQFLSAVCERLELSDVRIILGRAEEQASEPALREQYDYVLSRAVAKLNLLSELCLPFAKVGGKFFAFKSRHSDEEIKEAAKAVRVLGGRLDGVYEYQVPGSETLSRLICIQKISPTPAQYPRRYSRIKQKPL